MSVEPTLGEAHRRIDDTNHRLDQRVTVVAYEIARAADRGEVAALREDVKALDSRLTWAWRIAVTGVVLPVIVMVIGSVVAALILGGRS